jgi:glycosyltransferase involved in cell wall biosynthesis
LSGGDDPGRSIAFLLWGDVIEDWLAPLGLTVDDFTDQMTGGWSIGYVRALQLAGVSTVIFLFSREVSAPECRRHWETGATVWVLPASRVFRAIRALQLDEPLGARRAPVLVARAALRHLSPWLATPLRPFRRLLRAEGCQAILCQEYENPRFDVAMLVGASIGVKTFASFQGSAGQRSRLEAPLRPATLRRVGGLIIGPQAEARRVKQRYGVPDAKIARIFNPIDLEQWRPVPRGDARSALRLPDDILVVVCHGRIDFGDKGTNVLIAAWERVMSQRSDARLLLVGDGPDSVQLDDLLERRRIRGVEWIREFVTDRTLVQRILSAADAYVMASRREGFPVAPVEAMALGLPVVATDASGVPDIFEGGERHGGVIVPRDDAEALATALGRVLDDPALRRRLGERARARVEEGFSLPVIGRQLRDFVLGGR